MPGPDRHQLRGRLIAAGALLAVLVALTAIVPPPQQSVGYPSSYSAAPDGTKAAFLLARALGFDAEQWHDPATELPRGEDARNTLYVLVEPFDRPGARDAEAVRRFLDAGGAVLAIGQSAASLLPAGRARVGRPASDPVQYRAVIPGPLTLGAARIEMAEASRWTSDDPAHVVHYRYGPSAGVVSYRVGSGRVVWWADATPLLNSHIQQPEHLQLFLNTIGRRNGRILWDEYYHGEQRSLWSYLVATPVPWAIAQLGLVLAAVFATFSRRHGPIRDPQTVSRLSPTEFVETMGDLYRQAHATATAVQIGCDAARARIVRSLGLPPSVNPDDLRRALAARFTSDGEGLADWLERCGRTTGDSALPEDEALRLLQGLHSALARVERGRS